jgi:hypothetical protein
MHAAPFGFAGEQVRLPLGPVQLFPHPHSY